MRLLHNTISAAFITSMLIAAANAAPTSPATPYLAHYVYPQEIQTEDQYMDYLSKGAALRIANADLAATPFKQAQLRISAANWILARQLEPHATRLLLDIQCDADPGTAVACIAAARTQLDLARELIEGLNDPSVDASDAARARINLDTLQAFANAFNACWLPDTVDGESRDEQLRKAAFDLALLLEDNRKDVIAASSLWQAYIYEQRDRQKRALDLLPAALAEAKPDTPADFFARLLRVRCLIGSIDARTAAQSLLLRLETRANHWFRDPVRQDAAARTAAMFRRDILTKWRNQFDDNSGADRAQWCHKAIDRLNEQYFANTQTSPILRLEWAAPEIVDLDLPAPIPAEPMPNPSPQPSTNTPAVTPETGNSPPDQPAPQPTNAPNAPGT